MISQQLFNMTKELDSLFVKTYDEYVLAHRALEEFHKSVRDPKDESNRKERLEELNNILVHIQEKWAELMPVFNYIASRYEFTNTAVNSYEDFIKSLEKEIERQKNTPAAQS